MEQQRHHFPRKNKKWEIEESIWWKKIIAGEKNLVTSSKTDHDIFDTISLLMEQVLFVKRCSSHVIRIFLRSILTFYFFPSIITEFEVRWHPNDVHILSNCFHNYFSIKKCKSLFHLICMSLKNLHVSTIIQKNLADT